MRGKDYGYDLAAWHGHLVVSREGGYTWSNPDTLPKIMQSALTSDKWKTATERLSS